jgi:hypothetical protein
MRHAQSALSGRLRTAKQYSTSILSRRSFIKCAASAAVLSQTGVVALAQRATGETLYNGITLPAIWPPRLQYANDHPVRPPYLESPPPVIPIDVGRQLFVDDFLIAETNMSRTVHAANYHPANPILRPETEWELRDDYADRTKTPPNPSAMVFSDGVFYDPADRRFKMWYMGGYLMSTCYAESDDGVRWRRPSLDVVNGTNIVLKSYRDSSTVWLDQFTTDPRQRYKMTNWHDHSLEMHVSPDGIHWSGLGESGRAGDRSTFFYNPFRGVWVFSVRADSYATGASGRYRAYWETSDFALARGWSGQQPVAWVKADSRDIGLGAWAPPPELYNLDCVAYESVLLGLFSVWRGETDNREKINEITVGFSRDGFHWHRLGPQAFLGVNDTPGSWNYANVQSAGGGCLIVGDQLHFYVSGRTGIPGTSNPGVCSTGLATLRRDGFASMDWLPEQARVLKHGTYGASIGALTTRPVRFAGQHLFVNADTRGTDLHVEVLDANGAVLPGFGRDTCIPVRGDGTRLAVKWRTGALARLGNQPVRLRFVLERGLLFSFWVSRWPTGESGGYPAAGGPEFGGPVDVRA